MVNNKSKEISISILNLNFINLKKMLDIIMDTNLIFRIHYDVMDYDFVPNLSFGPSILKDIQNYSKYKFLVDCHMMVKIKNLSVLQYLKPFMDAKPEIITMHLESLTSVQLKEFLNIRNLKKQKIGLAINPNTPVNKILPLLSKLDLVLVMSVKPGFGGQTFINSSIEKINIIKEYILNNNLKTLIQVDGGINKKTISLCDNADILVIGSYLSNSCDKNEFIERFNSLNG